MSTELLKKFLRPRRSRAAAAATAVTAAGAVVLLATVSMGTAAAGTDATAADYREACNSGEACLWINATDDPNPVKAADQRALVITPGSGPDLDDVTDWGRGKVHGVTAEFTDNISNGWNLLPYDLCLMDTRDGSDSTYSQDGTKLNNLRTSSWIMVLRSGKSFSQLADWNDKIDYYTTAQPGKCPRGGVVFSSDTQEIVDSW